jgi:2-hydroxymuconate-semialdehyde hydrolase
MTVGQGEIQTGHTRTFYNHSGEGNAETILFLHGSGPGVSAWSNWQYALPFFDDKFDCLAPDLVGFGATEHPRNPPAGVRNWMRLWVD